MAIQLPPIPNRTPISTEEKLPTSMQGSLVRMLWLQWFQSIANNLSSAVAAFARATYTGRTSALPATAVQTQTLNTGLYRVNWSLRISTPASVSSSVTVTFGWTAGGVVCSSTAAAVTGNLTTTVQSGSLLLSVDSGTDITVATAYSSVGTPMGYDLSVVVEAV